MSKPIRKRKRRVTTKYRSKFEKKVADALEAHKLPVEYEATKLPYRLDLEYKPDWKVAGTYYIEAKGLFDYVERRKILAVLRANPGTDLRMVFMRDNKIAKNSKMRYSDWCKKEGIRFSIFPELPI